MLTRQSIAITQWSQLSNSERQATLARPEQSRSRELKETVRSIIERMKTEGDAALLDYTRQFDCADISQLVLNGEQKQALLAHVSERAKAAIDKAYDNIRAFHLAQTPEDITLNTSPGVRCTLKYTALESVGLYIPGGSATLPSTALMLGVPAQIAGCKTRVLVTPPNKQGQMSPEVVYAAEKCGIDTLVMCGGAQAIAALAYGTESVPKVDKVFGPGNAFVTEAKQQLSQNDSGISIDMPAGPSELLVLADDTANPRFVAADLLSQAEHGPDSQVILVTPSAALAQAVQAELVAQCNALPRVDIARQALASSRLIVTKNLAEAVAVTQSYAPEHLAIQTDAAAALSEQLTTAGSIFVGHYTPESGGDYATGTNHVLPTYGYAKNYSSLGLLDFYRRYTLQEVTRDGLADLADSITTLAEIEGLDAHKRAVTIRLEAQEDNV